MRPSEWRPIGVEDLEPQALEVVRSTSHCSVIAGPGSGKTELLAQRACYLLQTGLCPSPRRILAISFKKDAAKNLKERVAQRCRRKDALRFDSLTFDAFSKGLLDRFFQALPVIWRPTRDYEIYSPTDRSISDFFDTLRQLEPDDATKAAIRVFPQRSFMKARVLGMPLPSEGIDATDLGSRTARKWWDGDLRGRTQSRLSFPMIGRLAELLLRINPQILRAIRATYAYAFMDEFQDTTHVQYDLVKTAFLESHTILTAVGDNKQQIMRWAMALDDPFGAFENDFKAKRVPLIRNYRSSSKLVRIQYAIALLVDPQSKQAKAVKSVEVSGDVCTILEFETPKAEADHLADAILASIQENKLAPRDFALLVKQKADDYASLLEKAFRERGLKIRVEAELQDMLTEPLSVMLIAFLRAGMREHAGVAWSDCCEVLARCHGIDLSDQSDGRELQKNLGQFLLLLQKKLQEPAKNEKEVGALLHMILKFLGPERIKLIYPEYRQGQWFEELLEQVVKYLTKSCKATDNWESALADFEGQDTIPIMTIHKSKGLEYHTIVFVGLDDSAWWSFRNQPEESRSAFFVAFSRAKQRILFTYCEKRGGRKEIASLYEVLQAAGVKVYSIGTLN